MKIFESVAVAFSMYSKIPMPTVQWDKQNMRYVLCFFPLVGLAIGVVQWLWWQVALLLGCGVSLTAAVCVLLPVLLSGGIHVDGLMDTADAIGSWQPKERRLEILKDSHVGAFAVIACCGYFLAAFGIWSEVCAEDIVILSLGFALSRAWNAFGISTFACAKGSGLVATFSKGAEKRTVRVVVIVQILVCAAVMMRLDLLRGLAAVVVSLVVTVLCYRMAKKKFGGTTGDLQGFSQQMCELFMALAVVLLPRIVTFFTL